MNIEWFCPQRHLPGVLPIEDEAFEHPWSEVDFLAALNRPNVMGIVAMHPRNVPVGFAVYAVKNGHIHVLNFAVRRAFQRQGIGAYMIRRLIGRLRENHRSRILLHVRESNLSTQLFFRQCGFRAVAVIRNRYEDTGEDAYCMQYSLERRHAA